MGTNITPTEREVMLMRSNGMFSAEIARRINVKKRTVDQHLYNIYKKTGIRNLVELVNYVNQHMKD